jgi:hypothetical protein
MAEERFESYIQMTQYYPAFKLLNVQYVILPSKITVEPPHFQRLFSSRDLTVYQSLEFIPRIYPPKRIQFVESSREALALAAKGDFDPRDMTILEDRARAGQKIEYGESPVHLQLLKYTPNEIHLQTQSSQARLIVIANSFDPNWKASIDGQKVVPIIPANYVLQGVHIPEGTHLLKIYFFPDSLKTGIILSAIGLLAWGLLWVWGNRRIRPI